MTRLGLYALKTGQMPDAEAEPVIGENSISLPPMLRGTVLEPVAPTLVQMLRPTWSVEPCGWYYRDPRRASVRHPTSSPSIPSGRARLGSGEDHRPHDLPQGLARGPRRRREVTVPLFIAIQAVTEAVLGGFSWARSP